MILRIGTRGSKLALWQSEWIKAQIEAAYPDVHVELVRIKTTGDKILDSSLSKIGGKGLFVKEIEEALLSKRVDLAVHSMKDVPVELPDRLSLCSYPKRHEPRDVLVSTSGAGLQELPKGARVGTSSLRRAAQLLHQRPDLQVLSLRGNVDTRLGKLDRGDFDAVILAGAGLARLGFADRVTQYLDPEVMLPAIGQGALGLEVRADDTRTIEMLAFLNDIGTEAAVKAERAFLKELEGGCQVPIAAHATIEDVRLRLRGMVAELDGSKMVKSEAIGAPEQAHEVGIRLARELLEAGAAEILQRIYREEGF
ncbi:MAG: hydroxymethylbilane synthase [Deltaproteobacteria bacterium]|nr:MAG: hydroxymethylbilane synthase [Deltaproteobacteria bacterium]